MKRALLSSLCTAFLLPGFVSQALADARPTLMVVEAPWERFASSDFSVDSSIGCTGMPNRSCAPGVLCFRLPRVCKTWKVPVCGHSYGTLHVWWNDVPSKPKCYYHHGGSWISHPEASPHTGCAYNQCKDHCTYYNGRVDFAEYNYPQSYCSGSNIHTISWTEFTGWFLLQRYYRIKAQ